MSTLNKKKELQKINKKTKFYSVITTVLGIKDLC